METLSSSGSAEAAARHLVNSRGMEEALVKVGGITFSGVTNRLTYYLPSRYTYIISHIAYFVMRF